MSDYYRINISIFMKIVVQVQCSNWILHQTQSGRLWYKVQTLVLLKRSQARLPFLSLFASVKHGVGVTGFKDLTC